MTEESITTAPETTLDKTFDPKGLEAKWYAHWEQGGLFRPERPTPLPSPSSIRRPT
jgi:valyl-tRNA synthetase